MALSQNNDKVALGENVSATGLDFVWKGGKGCFMVNATFSSGTVKLQVLLHDGGGNDTWLDVKNQSGTAVSLTSAGAIPFELPPSRIRVNIATSTAVYAYAIGMPQ